MSTHRPCPVSHPKGADLELNPRNLLYIVFDNKGHILSSLLWHRSAMESLNAWRQPKMQSEKADILAPENIIQNVMDIIEGPSRTSTDDPAVTTETRQLLEVSTTLTNLGYRTEPVDHANLPTISISEIRALTQDQKLRGLSPSSVLFENLRQDWLEHGPDWRLAESFNEFRARTKGHEGNPDVVIVRREYDKGFVMMESRRYLFYFVRWYIWTRIEVFIARFANHPVLLGRTRAQARKGKDDEIGSAMGRRDSYFADISSSQSSWSKSSSDEFGDLHDEEECELIADIETSSELAETIPESVFSTERNGSTRLPSPEL